MFGMVVSMIAVRSVSTSSSATHIAFSATGRGLSMPTISGGSIVHSRGLRSGVPHWCFHVSSQSRHGHVFKYHSPHVQRNWKRSVDVQFSGGPISTLQAGVRVQFSHTVSPVSANVAFSVTTDLGATDAVEFDVHMIAFRSDFVHVCERHFHGVQRNWE